MEVTEPRLAPSRELARPRPCSVGGGRAISRDSDFGRWLSSAPLPVPQESYALSLATASRGQGCSHQTGLSHFLDQWSDREGTSETRRPHNPLNACDSPRANFSVRQLWHFCPAHLCRPPSCRCCPTPPGSCCPPRTASCWPEGELTANTLPTSRNKPHTKATAKSPSHTHACTRAFKGLPYRHNPSRTYLWTGAFQKNLISNIFSSFFATEMCWAGRK